MSAGELAININKFSHQIRKSNNKTIAFDIAVSGTNPLYFEQVLFQLRNSEETIMLVSLNAHQACLLLNQTLNEGFVYPNYTWILVETTVDSLVSANVLDPTIIYNGEQQSTCRAVLPQVGQQDDIFWVMCLLVVDLCLY